MIVSRPLGENHGCGEQSAGEMLPSFVNLTGDTCGGAVHSDGVGLAEHRGNFVTAPVGRRDVGQSYQVGGDPWPEPELTAQSRRLLQVAARFGQPPGAMFGDSQVPQSAGQSERIVCLGRESAGLFERRNRSRVVVPDDLVKCADPELCLGFPRT